MILPRELILKELESLYGATVLEEMDEIIKYYEIYSGEGQQWATTQNLDYSPTKFITNKVKKLIKEQARFMLGRTPEIKIIADKKDEVKAVKLEKKIHEVLNLNHFSDKLVKGARDCFIGKRVALKLAVADKSIKIAFRPSLEFIYDTEIDDTDKVNKIIFFYGMNNVSDKENQRIWKQKYEMISGKCLVSEGIYNGYGQEIEARKNQVYTKLDFIPSHIIINDSLSGENGESDVYEITQNQNHYNRLKSDDIDALKFNMFPQTVLTNATEETHKNLKISPGATIDLQAEDENQGTDAKKMEAQFSYDQRFENTINRINNDMYDLLNVPNVGLEQLKGLMQSGKSMKSLYWGLITRCYEKWTVWEPALRWMVEKIIILLKNLHPGEIDTEFDYKISIELIFPLIEDEEEERLNDLAEVREQTRSRKNYIQKWNINANPDAELKQIAIEQSLLQDAYMKGLDNNE